ncbi:MAG TPA: prepilin-type N-terminal cleavage/methylation domain-containing protein [Methylibium sp.]|uniref:prepilin-type N-terminal cleavage/methylation domain-containing protein n=1 Tax=Methylibium sp. TaxID=2067992 RepID=UPI002DC0571A|nr:prepilin-type N-terminal cleavage/methylation domain-containing protein [Methylibium sp.]HEU4459196.1 prepilin-type N-terminal cleavage/methylation domain-containing protein [Methylibium sp.]
MRTSAPGSRRAGGHGARRPAGFTLIELLVVVALIAIASAAATLALRDPASTQLEREAARLAALLESARTEARAAGLAVVWVPNADPAAAAFRFVGLPANSGLPERWLTPGVVAEVRDDRGPARGVVLGPEPLIGAQTIVLRLDEQRIALATDGLGPFGPVTEAGDGAVAR